LNVPNVTVLGNGGDVAHPVLPTMSEMIRNQRRTID
jgi:hypothetical protein